MVRGSRLAAAQRLPETAVEGAEALQVGYELPEGDGKEKEMFNAEKGKECSCSGSERDCHARQQQGARNGRRTREGSA